MKIKLGSNSIFQTFTLENIMIGDRIVLDVECQVILYITKNGSIGYECDIMDYQNVKYCGLSVGSTYKEFKEFTERFERESGIKLMDEIDEEIQIHTLKDVFLNKIKDKFNKSEQLNEFFN